MIRKPHKIDAKRSRMIVDVTPEIQMAIRLRAIKEGWTTGDVVAMAIRLRFPQDVDEAREAIKEPRPFQKGGES